MEEVTDAPANSSFQKRPTFLTVLCILTFIVSGYYFITSTISLFSDQTFDPEQWREISNQMSEAMEGTDDSSREVMETMMTAFADTLEAGKQNAVALALAGMAAAGLSILGAFFMFKLKKSGFYIYIASKLVAVILPLALLGVNLLTGMIYGFGAFVSLIFIVLYGLNRKYLH